MVAIVHYEVYTQKAGRWTLQARYVGNERTTAIESAKAFEETHRRPVRVIRETYDPGQNYGEETTVYEGRIKATPQSASFPQPLSDTSSQKDHSRNDLWTTSRQEVPDAPGASGRSRLALTIVRLLLVMLTALSTAMIGTGLVSLIMAQSSLARNTASITSFFIFISLFMVTVIPLMTKYVSLDFFQQRPPHPPPQKRSLKTHRKPSPKAPEKDRASDTPEPEHPSPQEPPFQDILTGMVIPDETALIPEQPRIEEKPGYPLPPQQAEQDPLASHPPIPSLEALSPTPPPPDPRPSTHRFGENRIIILKFLSDLLSTLETIRPHLDPYNRFGLNLYLTGACRALNRDHTLPSSEQNSLLCETIETAGTKPSHARHFIDQLENYRTESRYHNMIMAGQKNMDSYLLDKKTAFKTVKTVFQTWNTPHTRPVSASMATIMVADIGISTPSSTPPGSESETFHDTLAACNIIIRTAIQHHKGQEIKHTEKIIMACFEDTKNAVEAAIRIQKKYFEYQKKRDIPLFHLRIGINTGIPLIEDNDYFGPMVQIASSICAATPSGHIWIGAETRNQLPDTSGIRAVPLSAVTLPGVRYPQHLHEILWEPPG